MGSDMETSKYNTVGPVLPKGDVGGGQGRLLRGGLAGGQTYGNAEDRF